MSPAGDLERRFLTTVASRLVTLPYDLKVLYEAAADPDLDRSVRELAAATIIHVLGPNDASGDMRVIGYVDDVVLLRLALREVQKRGDEGAKAFRDRFAEEFAPVQQDLELFAGVLGESYRWLEQKSAGLAKGMYKGKKVTEYVDDEEASQFLYDEGLEFQTNYEFTEDHVADRLKRVQPILEHLAKRRADEARKIS